MCICVCFCFCILLLFCLFCLLEGAEIVNAWNRVKRCLCLKFRWEGVSLGGPWSPPPTRTRPDLTGLTSQASKILPELAERPEWRLRHCQAGNIGEKRGPSARPVPPRGATLFSTFWVVLSGADMGEKAEATQHESLLPEMESILPGIGRQWHEGAHPHSCSPPAACSQTPHASFSLDATRRASQPARHCSANNC